MTVLVRRLTPGDEGILALLAREEAEFDLEPRGAPAKSLEPAAARRYLENPAALQWAAFVGDEIVGHLQCIVLPLRAGEECELLLHDVGVRRSWRRRGIGRALMNEMDGWMRANRVSDIWVLADNPDAVEFYGACGFATEEPQPVYMLRHTPIGGRNGE